MGLTEEDKKIADEYRALTEEQKDAYLDKNGVVILGEVENEDGSVNWQMDISDEYQKVMEQYREAQGLATIDEAFTLLLTSWMEAEAQDQDASKTE